MNVFLLLFFDKFLYMKYCSSKSDERKDSPPVTEAIKLTASPIKKISKDTETEKLKRAKNKTEIPR